MDAGRGPKLALAGLSDLYSTDASAADLMMRHMHDYYCFSDRWNWWNLPSNCRRCLVSRKESTFGWLHALDPSVRPLAVVTNS
ncbi:unnamed protein product [Urochloa humidicola]